jgi:hypothetical protein
VPKPPEIHATFGDPVNAVVYNSPPGPGIGHPFRKITKVEKKVQNNLSQNRTPLLCFVRFLFWPLATGRFQDLKNDAGRSCVFPCKTIYSFFK